MTGFLKNCMKHSLGNLSVFSFASPTTLLMLAALAGCALPGGSNSELSQRVEQNGYSFLPPDESGWFIANRSVNRITLGKAGRVEGQSYVIEGSHLPLGKVSNPTQLTELIAEINKRDLPTPRFRVRQFDASEMSIDGASCVMTHLLVEDREPDTGTNVVTAMLVESMGSVCIHPGSKDLGIVLTFSHRSFPEDRDRGFEAYAQSVLLTQKFSDVNTQPAN